MTALTPYQALLHFTAQTVLIGYRRVRKILKEKMFMESPVKIIENIVVLGAGALGVACASGRERFLSRMGQSRLFFFNRSRLFDQATLSDQGKDGPAQVLHGPCLPHSSFTPDFLQTLVGPDANGPDTSCARISIWVAVPPPELDSTCFHLADVAAKLLRSEAAQKSFQGWPGMDIWVCSNGCLSAEVLHRLFKIQGPKVSLNRALFLTGFASDWEPKFRHMSVRYTGGSDVLWGEIGNNTSQKFTRNQKSAGKPGLARPFELQRVADIQAIEMQKFFVNMVLGWVVGPTELPNGFLLQNQKDIGLEKLATSFTHLFPAAGSARALLELLVRTAKDTAHNVNSVSRAWHRGKPENARYFRDFVLNAQGKSGRHDPVWSDFFCRHLLSESDSGR